MGGGVVSWPSSLHGQHARWLWEVIQARGVGVTEGETDAHCTDAAKILRRGLAQGFEGDARVGARLTSVTTDEDRILIGYRTPAGLRVEDVVVFDPVSHRIEADVSRLEGGASTTAIMMATLRGAHTRYDRPRILDDPLSEVLAGDLYAAMRNHVRDGAADDAGYDPRWNAAARARLAEDTALAAHRDGGVRQYVVLGAGLDSFAYRNPHDDLTVYEVDTPGSQAWKRQRLADCGIEIPPTTRHVPCDFEVDDLEGCLVGAGFRPDRPAVVAWLGVTYYLTADAVDRTLDTVAHWAGGTRLVLDYRLPQARWDDFPGWDPSLLRAMTAAVVASGERFPGELDHHEVTALLARHGFVDIETFDHDDIRRTYMDGQVEPVPGPVPVLCLARATVP